MSNAFVVAMGVGTVFVGLIALIILVKIMAAIIGVLFPDKRRESAPTQANVAAAGISAEPKQPEIADKGAFVAAVSAAIAEELGTDVSHIRIHSIKRLSQ